MSRWVSQKKLIIRRGTCNTIFGNTELKWISPFFHKGLLNLNKAKHQSYFYPVANAPRASHITMVNNKNEIFAKNLRLLLIKLIVIN
ncbi:uncharacterized protein LOC110118761 isoform X2 [Ceratitis capitata]|uniref:uncharacterized protein LOC110118761 isoform X2 n=1 Tax=Ceratitis capitata TaxID=7213 RepID=UPI000A0F9DCF|nr:uncharacterized protein LOC110118761 isoform X2 [Ceratitis capitata]